MPVRRGAVMDKFYPNFYSDTSSTYEPLDPLLRGRSLQRSYSANSTPQFVRHSTYGSISSTASSVSSISPPTSPLGPQSPSMAGPGLAPVGVGVHTRSSCYAPGGSLHRAAGARRSIHFGARGSMTGELRYSSMRMPRRPIRSENSDKVSGDFRGERRLSPVVSVNDCFRATAILLLFQNSSISSVQTDERLKEGKSWSRRESRKSIHPSRCFE